MLAGFMSAFLYERHPLYPGESETLAKHVVNEIKREVFTEQKTAAPDQT